MSAKKTKTFRDMRIKNRVANPRSSRSQHFEDDIIDVAVSQIMTRVNEIMDDILFWGDMVHVQNFSPDTMVHS